MKNLPSFSGQIDAVLHLTYGFSQPDENGAADDTVANVKLSHLGNLRDGGDVAIIQTMPGVEFKARGYGGERLRL